VENELRELDQRKNEFLATLAHELRNPLAPAAQRPRGDAPAAPTRLPRRRAR
jgi:signal transduction histidine kinase